MNRSDSRTKINKLLLTSKAFHKISDSKKTKATSNDIDLSQKPRNCFEIIFSCY